MTSAAAQQDAADTAHDIADDMDRSTDFDDVPDTSTTVQLTIVRAEPLDSTDPIDEDDVAEDEKPENLPGVISLHLDALRDRDADGEILDLVTNELRRITGVRNVRSFRGRHSA